MPSRDQLLDPEFIPTHGMLRWIETGNIDPVRPTTNPQNAGRILQVFNSTDGEWQDVPVVWKQELDDKGID